MRQWNKMLPLLTFFFYLSLTIATITFSHQTPNLNIWPKPRTILWPTPKATLLSPNFTIISPPHRYLTPSIHRYLRQILTEHHSPLRQIPVSFSVNFPLTSLTLTITSLSTPLHHEVNESYTLSISAVGSSADLTAETVWGAMRGLETFSQLVWGETPMIAIGVLITDFPMFAHRGLMLDTSRSFYEVEDVLRTIRVMSWNKLNVFHWHLTDSQSFPINLGSEPDLAGMGSYGEAMVYSAEDVERIVEFGLEHGVRVLPEIDMPGHAGSWAEAYPDIVTCANMFWWPAGTAWDDRLASEPGTGQLNPLNPKTYQVLKNVFRDMASMFPEPFYHAGGDEIIPGCWKADPAIQTFLSNGGTLSQLLDIFINSTFPYLVSLNRTVIYWEDVLLDASIKVNPIMIPPENTILQTWNNGPYNTKRIVSSGYRAIVSSADFYYLDCGHGGFLGNDSQYDQQTSSDGSWCTPFKTWQTIYNYDITYGLNKEEAKLVLGGEVVLWSEQADPSVLDARLWPRASALAESLWSGNRDEITGAKRYAEATDRLNEWRHRMVSRGIGAEPIQPLWCIRNPGMCNTVHPSE